MCSNKNYVVVIRVELVFRLFVFDTFSMFRDIGGLKRHQNLDMLEGNCLKVTVVFVCYVSTVK